jgi:hypothetical protein
MIEQILSIGRIQITDTLAEQYDAFGSDDMLHQQLRLSRTALSFTVGFFLGCRVNKDLENAWGPFSSLTFSITNLVTRLLISDRVLKLRMAAGNPRFLLGIPYAINSYLYTRYNSGYIERLYQERKRAYFEVDPKQTVYNHIKLETNVDPDLVSDRKRAYRRVVGCIIHYHAIRLFKSFYSGFVLGLFEVNSGFKLHNLVEESLNLVIEKANP